MEGVFLLNLIHVFLSSVVQTRTNNVFLSVSASFPRSLMAIVFCLQATKSVALQTLKLSDNA